MIRRPTRSTLFPYTTLSDLGDGAGRREDPGPDRRRSTDDVPPVVGSGGGSGVRPHPIRRPPGGDRKSTRLNSSHVEISYAVFCLKKKKIHNTYVTFIN